MIATRHDIRADLHAHTRASDGALEAAVLVREAAGRGLTHLAITDHDTIAGVAPARDAAAEYGIAIVPGIELTCEADGVEIHMLGLGVDTANASLASFAAATRERRRTRFLAMIGKLRDFCGVREIDPAKLDNDHDASLGRPQLARILVQLGKVQRVQDAFDRWLGKGQAAYVPNDPPGYHAASEAIRAAGGVPVLAHCGLYREGEALAARLLDEGSIAGIEIFHPDHSHSRRKRLMDMAAEKNALISGGADFHDFGSRKASHFGRTYLTAAHFEPLAAAWGLAV